jgi:hypothetical protein
LRYNGGDNSWKNPAFTISDSILSELQALQLLLQLTAGMDVLEYGQKGGVDSLRINSLLALYNLPPLAFFNIGDGITNVKQDVPRNPVQSVFRNHGIVSTPVLKERMWDVNNNHSIIRPALRDILLVPPPSDPSIDVQRTWNS